MPLYDGQNRNMNFDPGNPPEPDEDGLEPEIPEEDEPEDTPPEILESLLADADRIEMEQDSFPKVCGDCKQKNLTEHVHLVMCRCCSQHYCVHFASNVDPQFCDECCNKVEMTEEVIHKKTEHYNEEKDKVYTRHQKARLIRFSGEDWLFFSRKFNTMDDTERLLAIEYHQGCLTHLLYERERKRLEHFHRNAGKAMPVGLPTVMPDGTTKVETKTKKVRTVSADKTAKSLQTLMAILSTLKSQGKTDEEIIKLLGKK